MTKIEVLKIFGENLKTKRKNTGYSINEFADLMNLSVPTIKSIERGTRGTSLDNYLKMAELLHTSLEEMADIYSKNGILKLSAPLPQKYNNRALLTALCRNLDNEQIDDVIKYVEDLLTDSQENNGND